MSCLSLFPPRSDTSFDPFLLAKESLMAKAASEKMRALAGMAQLVGTSSCGRKVVGSIPGCGTCLGCRFNPQSWCICPPCMGGNQSLSGIDVSFSLPSSFSCSLSRSNEKMSLSKEYIYSLLQGQGEEERKADSANNQKKEKENIQD